MADEYKYRTFVIVGRIYGPKTSVSKHRLYWGIHNEIDQIGPEAVNIDHILIEDGEDK